MRLNAIINVEKSIEIDNNFMDNTFMFLLFLDYFLSNIFSFFPIYRTTKARIIYIIKKFSSISKYNNTSGKNPDALRIQPH